MSAFISGKMQEYISNIEFSLNFEDKKSVRVRIGDVVQYDGTIAKYVKQPSGEEITGKTTSLRSAVASNWLTLNVPGAPTGPININVKTSKVRDTVVYKAPDYDSLKGGSFDDYVKKDAGIVVAGMPVIKEEDQIVKTIEFNRTSGSSQKPGGGKMEVAGDQVNVKDISTTVSSSTATGIQRTQKTVVIQADDGHADHVIVGKRKTAAVVETPKAKNTFTVDSFTPTIPDGATMAEVKRATTQNFDGSQDGRVVKKIGENKMPPEPTEVEGIVLKKTDFSAKPSLGSTPVADLSGVKTQSEVNEIEEEISKKTAAPMVGKKNYVDMLPEDWSSLHWVKKEKFIMGIDDIEFLKFIMKVESIKAVHTACRKRMGELAKSSNG
jgi:hypothetical protein